MRRALAGIAVSAWLASGAPASAEVRLSMSHGRVSVHATNASVAQILDEWARVGQTRIVNAEKIPGGPITIELEDVAEAEALEIILRSVSGYLAAPRPTAEAALSRFDRIVVVPTSAPVASPAQTPARGGVSDGTAMQRPGFQGGFPGRPPFPVVGGPEIYTRPGAPGADDQNDDGAPITNIAMPARGGVFNDFQQPQTIEVKDPGPDGVDAQPPPMPPGQLIPNPAPPAGTTSPFGGTSVPGVIVQPAGR